MSELEELYGPLAPQSDHRPGETEAKGMHRMEQTDESDILNTTEPALRRCPYCQQLHNTNTIEDCPLNTRKKGLPLMEHDELEALYGPAATYSEHARGETLRFTEDGQEKQGEILWVCAPGQVVEGGAFHPITYIVDTGHGFPSLVYPSAILENND